MITRHSQADKWQKEIIEQGHSKRKFNDVCVGRS